MRLLSPRDFLEFIVCTSTPRLPSILRFLLWIICKYCILQRRLSSMFQLAQDLIGECRPFFQIILLPTMVFLLLQVVLQVILRFIREFVLRKFDKNHWGMNILVGILRPGFPVWPFLLLWFFASVLPGPLKTYIGGQVVFPIYLYNAYALMNCITDIFILWGLFILFLDKVGYLLPILLPKRLEYSEVNTRLRQSRWALPLDLLQLTMTSVYLFLIRDNGIGILGAPLLLQVIVHFALRVFSTRSAIRAGKWPNVCTIITFLLTTPFAARTHDEGVLMDYFVSLLAWQICVKTSATGVSDLSRDIDDILDHVPGIALGIDWKLYLDFEALRRLVQWTPGHS